MTCIVGLVHDSTVYIGGDSAGVAGWNSQPRADTKVFTNGPYAFGFTTSFRMGQLLHHALTLPEPPTNPDDLDRFLVIDFIDIVREALKKGGYAEKEKEAEVGGTFLLGVHGRLFRVGNDYQVGESLNYYDAAGSGETVALGALHALEGLNPLESVLTALEAAEHHSAAVRGPFNVVQVTHG